MADTNFSAGTVVASSWLDDVNTNTYAILSAVAGTNTITATGASTVTVGYPRGVAFRFIPQNTNTGAVTINISGLGAKAVTKYGTTPLVAGDIVVGSWAYIAYDGTQFQLVNPLSVPTNVSALPGRLLNVQTFTANGTYTPTTGTTSVVVEVVGGGGAGGSTSVTGVGVISLGGGGGSGGYSKGRYTTGFAGVSVVVGSGGTAGGVGASGGSGGTSSFGALIQATGGAGGAASTASAGPAVVGGSPGVGTLGTITNLTGQRGGLAWGQFSLVYCSSGAGGSSVLSGGATSATAVTASTNQAGTAATGIGSGGSGGASGQSQGGAGGGAGTTGIVIVYEYS